MSNYEGNVRNQAWFFLVGSFFIGLTAFDVNLPFFDKILTFPMRPLEKGVESLATSPYDWIIMPIYYGFFSILGIVLLFIFFRSVFFGSHKDDPEAEQEEPTEREKQLNDRASALAGLTGLILAFFSLLLFCPESLSRDQILRIFSFAMLGAVSMRFFILATLLRKERLSNETPSILSDTSEMALENPKSP